MEESNRNSQTEQEASMRQQSRRRRAPIIVAIIAIAAIAAIVAIVAVWLLWPKQTGKPVAAPRTVLFEESPQTPTTEEQRLTLTPEQLRSAQFKIETAGEAPSAEAAGQMATGVVQAN